MTPNDVGLKRLLRFPIGTVPDLRRADEICQDETLTIHLGNLNLEKASPPQKIDIGIPRKNTSWKECIES